MYEATCTFRKHPANYFCLTLPPRMESLVSLLVYVQRRRTAASECMSGCYSDKNQ